MTKIIDIKSLNFNFEKPQEVRLHDYLHTVKNPYRYMCNGYIVNIKFSGTEDFESCVAQSLNSLE